MSPALPYLRGLRKSDLVVLAEVSNLQEYVPLSEFDICLTKQ